MRLIPKDLRASLPQSSEARFKHLAPIPETLSHPASLPTKTQTVCRGMTPISISLGSLRYPFHIKTLYLCCRASTGGATKSMTGPVD
jgi:hypothetical protein